MESYFGNHSGAQMYGYETENYVNGPSLDNVPSIVLSPLETPAPDNKRRWPLRPHLEFSKEIPCKDVSGFHENLEKQFVLATMRGYQTSGFEFNKLKGVPANRSMNEAELVQEQVHEYLPTDYEHTEMEEGIYGIDNELLNKESSRFKYGNSEYPAVYGVGLAGSDSTLQRDRGNLTVPKKRAGFTISGRYSGWQSEKTSITGTVDGLNSY